MDEIPQIVNLDMLGSGLYFSPATAKHWYWFVGGHEDQAWSSKVGDYVDLDDPNYVAWLVNGGSTTRILNEGELREVLFDNGVRARRRYSFLEFMELFTEAEQLTLVQAAMTQAPIKLWYDKALGAQYIDLDDPRTGDGLQDLVDANLITAERRAAVLAGQGPE